MGLTLDELVETTFQISYHTKGGVSAQYVDTLPPAEVGLYMEHLLAQRKRENKEAKRLAGKK